MGGKEENSLMHTAETPSDSPQDIFILPTVPLPGLCISVLFSLLHRL